MQGIIFCRVSSREQEEGYSIDAQLARLREYCKRKNIDVLDEITLTESSTRGSRKQFYDMLKKIKKQKQTMAIVCDKVDRLQRCFKELPILDELRLKGKLVMHFHMEHLILHKDSTAQELSNWQFSILQASSYVNSISDNVKRSFDLMRKSGKLTGMAPIGYLNDTNPNGRVSNGVILDPERAVYIKKMFELYSTGLHTLESLRKQSIEWGLKNKTKTNTYMSIDQINKMLSNPFYYGIMRIKGELYPHIYPRIITKELFDKCQEVKAGKSKGHFKFTPADYVLRGMVHCKKCGRTVSPETAKGIVYLRPNGYCRRNCDCSRIKEADVLNKIAKTLKQIHIPPALVEEYKKSVEQSMGINNELRQKTIEHFKSEYTSTEKRLNKLIDMYADLHITKEVFLKKQNEYTLELQDVQ